MNAAEFSTEVAKKFSLSLSFRCYPSLRSTAVILVVGTVFPYMGYFLQTQNCCRDLQWQERATKDLQYLKEMIPNRSMQKIEIPGLVTGIRLIITTIVIMVFMIKI